MKRIRDFSILCLVIGIGMVVAEFVFDTALLARLSTHFAIAFGLIVLGSALGAVYDAMRKLDRKTASKENPKDSEKDKD